MRIGLAFDLKPATRPPGSPDDWAEEFDSPETVAALADALRRLGHAVSELGNGRPLVEKLLADPPDLVFNFAEGTGTARTRESRVPAVCELLGIPHTGSDAVALGLALDKEVARNLVEAAGVRVPEGITLPPPLTDYDGDLAEFPGLLEEAELTLPLIVKPAWEGSSKGVRRASLVRTPEEFGPAVAALWRDYRQPALVEEFIDGDEVTVGVMGNAPPHVLGIMRILPRDAAEPFVYGLEAKRDYANRVTYESPARLDRAAVTELEYAALAAYEALGLRDYARLDFRVRNGEPYFLEANPLPGLNPVTSDLAILAKGYDLDFDTLVGAILREATDRLGL